MASQYLLKPKHIGDISIYPERSTLEHIYDFPADYLIIGQQYVDKLKEMNYLVKGNKFFLIFFNRYQSNGEITFAKENALDPDGKGSQIVNVGVNPEIFNKLTEKEKSIFITKLIAEILIGYYSRYSINLSMINEVRDLILKYGGDLLVKYKEKETEKYKLVFSYQTKAHDEADAIIKYTDFLNPDKNKKITVHLRDFEDIDHVIKCTKVKGDEVKIIKV